MDGARLQQQRGDVAVRLLELIEHVAHRGGGAHAALLLLPHAERALRLSGKALPAERGNLANEVEGADGCRLVYVAPVDVCGCQIGVARTVVSAPAHIRGIECALWGRLGTIGTPVVCLGAAWLFPSRKGRCVGPVGRALDQHHDQCHVNNLDLFSSKNF